MNFHYSELSPLDLFLVRSPGPGLGNLLFPVCRAYLGSLRIGGIFVNPTWRQIKFGTYFRNEIDKRTYSEIIIQNHSCGDLVNFLRAKTAVKVSELNVLNLDLNRDVCVKYFGCRNYFYDLIDRRDCLRNWIRDWQCVGVGTGAKFKLVIHIRRGDFTQGEEQSLSETCFTSPIQWYRNASQRVIDDEKLRPDEILVLTDGNLVEIRQELGLNAFYSNNLGGLNALELMVLGANCNYRIGSRSTFSLWMHFLGTGITFFEKKFEVNKYYPIFEGNDVMLVD